MIYDHECNGAELRRKERLMLDRLQPAFRDAGLGRIVPHRGRAHSIAVRRDS